jgi:glycerol-3-phosphate dehydrogenase (NAD(P)+)
VAAGLPTAVTLACSGGDAQWQRLAPAIARPTFRPYYSADVIGAEIGGAVKNVLAIACGVVEGLGLGQNARAALISRGFAEMQRFGLAMGAQAETLSGLSGLGDLVLTCSSSSSRNFSLGKALGEGQTASAALAGRATVAEGAYTAPVLADLARQKGIAMPLVDAVVTLVQGQAPARDVVASLLAAPCARNVRLADSSFRAGFRGEGRTGRYRRAGQGRAHQFLRFRAAPGRQRAVPVHRRAPLWRGHVGRYASATLVVELAAQLATLGQKRGLAQQLAKEDRPGASVVADALLLSALVSVLCAVLLWLVPIAMFPSGDYTSTERLLPLAILRARWAMWRWPRWPIALTWAPRCAPRGVEPWTQSLAAGGSGSPGNGGRRCATAG